MPEPRLTEEKIEALLTAIERGSLFRSDGDSRNIVQLCEAFRQVRADLQAEQGLRLAADQNEALQRERAANAEATLRQVREDNAVQATKVAEYRSGAILARDVAVMIETARQERDAAREQVRKLRADIYYAMNIVDWDKVSGSYIVERVYEVLTASEQEE